MDDHYLSHDNSPQLVKLNTIALTTSAHFYKILSQDGYEITKVFIWMTHYLSHHNSPQLVKLNTIALTTSAHFYKTLSQNAHEIKKVIIWMTPILVITI